MIKRKTSLLENLLMFFRFLREKGYAIGPGEESDCLVAIQKTNALSDPDIFRLSLRAILARSQKQQMKFDELFIQFFKELEKAVESKIKDDDGEASKKQSGSSTQGPSLSALKDWLFRNDSEKEEAEIAKHSALEAFTKKDFSSFSESGLEELSSLLKQLKKSLANRKSRRKTAGKKKSALDIRRTLRANLRNGSELVELKYQEKKIEKLRIVVICDVSRSMELYSRFLVQFLYCFPQVYSKIETFVFSTQLYRVTPELQYREFDEALTALSEQVPGWSGGTRIGESLNQFVGDYASRMLDQKTVLIILSDGWDTGETGLLSQSMRQIHRKAAKVIWLNPLAGNPAYKPESLGMQAAWPYIDVFAPAHDLESLKAILPFLSVKKTQKLFGKLLR